MTKQDLQRLAKIKELRFEQSYTLQQIADVYNISRERVRQLIGNTGKGIVKQKRRKMILEHPEMTDGELASSLGVLPACVYTYRKGTFHAVSGGNYKSKYEAIIYVSELLSKFGINHKLIAEWHGCDIVLDNDKRLDIITAGKKCKPPSQEYYHYRFHVHPSRADYYICYIVPTKELFIIPAKEVGSSGFISISWPTVLKRTRYMKYYNNFDLLR